MLVHIFKHADLVWFHVGQSNIRSRRAVERLGAVLSHEEEQALDGASYTQLYFQLGAQSYRDRQRASADVWPAGPVFALIPDLSHTPYAKEYRQ